MIRNILLTLFVIFWIHAQAQQSSPNIIFILADDLGIGDVSSFNPGSKIMTTNIERIARNGIRFSNAHSGSSVCTPTRYGILTGRYAWRTRLKSNVLLPYDSSLIEPGRTTMASMLKKQGYQTAAFGKWHLGWNWSTKDGGKPIDNQKMNNLDYTKALQGGPLDVGFDHFFGIDAPNYPPYTYIEDRKIVEVPSFFYARHPYRDCRPGTGIPDWKLETILQTIASRSVNYIKDASSIGKPFFMYLALTAPHTPIAPSKSFEGRSNLNVYADFVKEMDHVVGQILNALEENGIINNTLVVFTADNGCSPEADFNYLAAHGHMPSMVFRGQKADLYEGGHRIPLLVQWPEKIAGGASIDQIVSLNDFMASFASISGYHLSDLEAEDSYNLLPLLLKQGHTKKIRKAIVHHSYHGDFAIRKGNWKLLLTPSSGGWSYPSKKEEYQQLPPMQLYDLEKDPGEKINLYSSNMKKVRQLQQLLYSYQRSARSAPLHFKKD